VISSVFFLLLFFAAFTSSIALIEPAVAWLMEHWQLSRQKAVGLAGCACWVLSLGTILSFTQPKSFLWMGKTMYEWIDFITANILLPLGGIMIAVFVGWMIRAPLFENTLRWSAQKTGFQLWQVMLRFFAPVAILLILLASFQVI
jgi:SNF family Na+-dependent transporter